MVELCDQNRNEEIRSEQMCNFFLIWGPEPTRFKSELSSLWINPIDHTLDILNLRSREKHNPKSQPKATPYRFAINLKT